MYVCIMEQPSKNVAINFKNYKVTSVIFKANPDLNATTRELDVKMEVNPVFINETEFGVKCNIDVDDHQNALSINLESIAYFNTADVMTEDFKQSNFFKINAPAIFFPYIRAYITTITVNAGYNPIILPTFNFTQVK